MAPDSGMGGKRGAAPRVAGGRAERRARPAGRERARAWEGALKAYFVAGTDTGVGKTTVASALLVAARARGLRVTAMKPAESGCARGPGGELEPADALQLRAAAGLSGPVEAICPYRLEFPLAPGAAAARAGVVIEPARISRAWASAVASDPDFGLVEGAGGLLVPFGADWMAVDLARILSLPVVLVARNALGTINHTLLSIEALRRRDLAVGGVILNEEASRTGDVSRLDNAGEIARWGGVRVLGVLPHLPGASLAALGEAASRHLDLAVLLP